MKLAAALLVLAPALAHASGPARPFPQHVTYAAGALRPSPSAAAQDAAVAAYYDQWKADFVTGAGAAPGQFRIRFGKAAPNAALTVSEGQGYGMVIVALLAGHDPDAQALFDGLWAFARAHPSIVDARLMAFQVPPPPDEPGGTDSAFDGDCDMAYALLLADAQWGSAGAVDYAAAAATLIGAIAESTIGPHSRLPLLGDWTEPDGRKFSEYTPRSSDFMLDHFRAFGAATGDPLWAEVLAASQDAIAGLAPYGFDKKRGVATGLLPDFLRVSPLTLAPKPVGGKFLEASSDGSYSYNATRDPWRIGTDALLTGDARSLAAARAVAGWSRLATGGDPQQLRAGYRLSGKPLGHSHFFTIVFAAPLGVAAMNAPGEQAWLDALYAAVAATHEDYYEDSVTLQCLLVMSGNWWAPGA